MHDLASPTPVPSPDDTPVERIAGDRARGLLILGDHASNGVPAAYRSLGLPPSAFSRHIAYDIGVRALTYALADALGAPAVLSTFSRLLIDPNRGEDDPTLIMRLSDGAVVPANARYDDNERRHRLETYHRPYHAAISAEIDAFQAHGLVPVILSIHSYTPTWKGVPRPWHAGVLWDKDPRLAVPLLEGLATAPDLIIGDNEPYDGALRNDTMYRHGTQLGLAHALLEVRQDLIANEDGVRVWAERLTPLIGRVMAAAPDLHVVRFYGSRTV